MAVIGPFVIRRFDQGISLVRYPRVQTSKQSTQAHGRQYLTADTRSVFHIK